VRVSLAFAARLLPVRQASQDAGSTQQFINLGGLSSTAMDLDVLDEGDETVGQTLKRRYSHFTAWIVRANRPEEPIA
jgi:hypothetical protein